MPGNQSPVATAPLTPLQLRQIAGNDFPFVAAWLASNLRAPQTTPPAAIAVGVSPFTYTNASNFWQQVTISGGTVTVISMSAGGVTGETAGVYQLRPGDSVTVTYSVAPTNFTAVNIM